ncbi:hypothetical protein T190115A13A_80226 [Tenacibaculum sp. 190524A02b]|uniref:Uncharacterized protein n=1 Tax=Tenacibaculum vairaonense TaxID=3137860 RepID=A0ABP1FE84_9FLAO
MEETKRIALVVVYTAEIPKDLEESKIYEELEFLEHEITLRVDCDNDDFDGVVCFEQQNELLGETYNINVDEQYSVGKA